MAGTPPRVPDNPPRTCGCSAESLTALACGDQYCNQCLGDLVRSAFAVPQRLPVRCCLRAIPFGSIEQVLEPEEVTYYRFLVRKEVERRRSRFGDGQWRHTLFCDYCGGKIPQDKTSTAPPIMDCGHVICDTCSETLRASAESIGSKSATCCGTPLVAPRGRPGRTRKVRKSSIDESDDGGRAGPQTRLSALLAKGRPNTKGKRPMKASQELVDLIANDLSVDEDTDTKEVCETCSNPVDILTNRFRATCGHVFCRSCLRQRCERALKNDEEGSVGFPLRCCSKLIALDIIRPVLTKRVFTKYEVLFRKYDDTPFKRLIGLKRANDDAATEPSKKKRTREKDASASDDDEDGKSCVACLDPVEGEVVIAPCSHTYCVSCLTLMAKTSLKDRNLVPVRCCGTEFPQDFLERVLTPTSLAKYKRFMAEKDWTKSDLKSDRDYAVSVQRVRGKQCPTCGIGVTKVSGCNWMTCTSGHGFCWRCVKSSCSCGRAYAYN